MKKTSLLASVTLIASLGLVGCGGTASSSLTTSNISGTAIDPELKGATVCLDLNQDNNCTPDEPTAITDENGKFNLRITEEQLKSTAPLLAIGGIDKESEAVFNGKLLADLNSDTQNITPLTTLAYEKIKENMRSGLSDVKSDISSLEDRLGLSSKTIQANIITLAEEGNTSAMKVALALQKAAEAISPSDTLRFYHALSVEMSQSHTATLLESIMNITPPELKNHVNSMVTEILNSTLDAPYALSEKIRTDAIELGIDQEERIHEIPNRSTERNTTTKIPTESHEENITTHIPAGI